jgi:8-oxo-dGTP pyrophosphatase MutT (NUDIX family)
VAGLDHPSEHSAGGVVLRGEDCVVIVPTRLSAAGRKVLALPKGHIDPGETAVQAALREVREEAGIEASVIEDLGPVRYWYMRDGRRVAKRVDFFLLAYECGELEDHDDEVEVARWMPLREAATALSYPGEREVANRALSRTASDE